MKIKLDVSSESRQRIHMKNQALFSSKDKSKKIKMSSAAIFVWRSKGQESFSCFNVQARMFVACYNARFPTVRKNNITIILPTNTRTQSTSDIARKSRSNVGMLMCTS